MIRSLYSGASGMYAQQMNIDTIANNMANVNTNGYKKSRMQFEDLMYQTIKEAGAATSDSTRRPTELAVGAGVRAVATQRSFSQGSLQNTGNPLDIAIAGEGFFQLVNAEGDTVYTRDGSFKLDAEGQIVTSSGYFLEPGTTIPADTEALSITPDGIVLARVYGEVEAQEIGQIELARFVNAAGLRSLGGNVYAETEASGQPITGAPTSQTFGAVEQGWIESSNVELVEEMVNMITAQRAYDLNSKVIRTSDAMIQTANNIKR
ncbi:MAG: flagellar basal-body rod protein FlgG [Candidatus Cloacimonetes bacterium]|nr:flagellar basal-body rod protein FlgG [Candidatus Cloacimonadota bacterium]